MHISDGILSPLVYISGYLVAAGIAKTTMRKIKTDKIPEVSVMTSVFFVASLIHIPLGPTSVHLILNGLIGIVLGPCAFLAILVGITLQALLFQHGGITTIGINACMMGIPALIVYQLFKLRVKFPLKNRNYKYVNGIWGAAMGGLSIFMSTIVLAVLLVTTGENFIKVAGYAVLAHIPVMIVEAVIVGFTVSFLTIVKPEVLGIKINASGNR
ncbi:MAG: cobalt transporter CbiM [bacterium]